MLLILILVYIAYVIFWLFFHVFFHLKKNIVVNDISCLDCLQATRGASFSFREIFFPPDSHLTF